MFALDYLISVLILIYLILKFVVMKTALCTRSLSSGLSLLESQTVVSLVHAVLCAQRHL